MELIAQLASEVNRELTPQEIRLVANMAQKMGPDLSAGEIQMISKMAPTLDQHDVEMVAQMIKAIESPAGEGEIALMSILTKVASLRADDAMTVDEAAELANMVKNLLNACLHFSFVAFTLYRIFFYEFYSENNHQALLAR